MGSGFALQVAEKAKEKYKTRKIKPAALLIQVFRFIPLLCFYLVEII